MTTERTIDLERRALGEVEMLGEERWEEVHRRTIPYQFSAVA